MRIAVGHSDEPEAGVAVAEALAQVESQVQGGRPIAVSVYTCKATDHAGAVAAIRARLPGIPLIGCTTDGECSSVLCFAEDSVVVTLFLSDTLLAHSAMAVGLSKGVRTTVARAWADLARHGTPSLVVVLSESLGVSGSAVVTALDAHVPAGIPVVGGTAGDQWEFTETHQFCDDAVLTDAVVLLGFFGPMRVAVGVASGWQPMGPRARVTRSEGSVVSEIDGQPALAWFADYFGQREAPSPEHPFAVYDPPDSDEFYLRAPIQLAADGALVFTGDVPTGTAVRITEATRDAILGGAAEAVAAAAERFDGVPSALLVFSCAARKQVLGTRTREEVDRLQARTGRDLPLAGFYTYGEVARISPDSPVRFHNETVVAVLLGE